LRYSVYLSFIISGYLFDFSDFLSAFFLGITELIADAILSALSIILPNYGPFGIGSLSGNYSATGRKSLFLR